MRKGFHPSWLCVCQKAITRFFRKRSEPVVQAYPEGSDLVFTRAYSEPPRAETPEEYHARREAQRLSDEAYDDAELKRLEDDWRVHQRRIHNMEMG